MNSYFKTAEEIAVLFQQAINTLHQQDYAAAQELFNTAWRHDPYNGNAHYELALYHAAAKNAGDFRYHYFICRNLDAAYEQRILTHEEVLNAFNTGELEEIIALNVLDGYPIKEFSSVDQLGGEVYLRFRLSHIPEIVAIYDEVFHNSWFDNCFNILETPPKWPGIVKHEELAKMEYFRLCYYRWVGQVDQPTEVVYETLKKLSTYTQDVRFLIESEYEEFIDEVIIQNGAFYFYRHIIDSDPLIDSDPKSDRRAYFESLVQAYPNDAMLREWLCKEW